MDSAITLLIVTKNFFVSPVHSFQMSCFVWYRCQAWVFGYDHYCLFTYCCLMMTFCWWTVMQKNAQKNWYWQCVDCEICGPCLAHKSGVIITPGFRPGLSFFIVWHYELWTNCYLENMYVNWLYRLILLIFVNMDFHFSVHLDFEMEVWRFWLGL